MDKIRVPFKDVRGLGDIVSPKSSSDFETAGALSTDTAVVDNIDSSVYDLEFAQGDIDHLELDCPEIIQSGDQASLDATLFDDMGFGVSGQSVNFYRICTPLLELSAPSIIQSGDASTISARFRDSVDGSYEPVSGETVNFYRVYAPKLDLNAPAIIQNGDTSTISARFTDYEDGSYEPVSGETVNFYRVYEPKLKVVSVPPFIQSGDSATISARITDYNDGSYEPVSGQTVKFYRTGKELIHDSTEYTKTYSSTSNVLKIIDGIKNIYTTNWSFECDFKTDGEARVFIGQESTILGDNPMQEIGYIGATSTLEARAGYRTTQTVPAPNWGGSFTADTYTHVKMVYDATNKVMSYYVGDMTTAVTTQSIPVNFEIVSEWAIAIVCWSSTTNGVSVKNLKLMNMEG